jgi:hypothetical protein
MFRKIGLFPSSDEGKETPTLLGPLERANLNHWTTQVKDTLRLTVSQSVCLDVGPFVIFMTRCLLPLTIVVVSLWGALSDERSGLSIVSHS